MNVDANAVIDKLADQIKEMVKGIAVKDCLIDMLQKQLNDLSPSK